MGLQFPVVKLLDYRESERWQTLDASDNPFAVIVMAHLEAQATRRSPKERYHSKLRLVRGLYRKGFTKKDVLEVFYEEEHKMAFISPFERRASERGLHQGALQTARGAVLEALDTRFHRVPPTVAQQIQNLDDLTALKGLLRQAITAATLAEFQQHLPQ